MFKLGGKIYANFFSLRIFPHVPRGGVILFFLLKQDFPSHLVRSLTFTDRSAQKWWPKQKILICVTVLSELSQELFDLKMKMSGLSIFLCKMVQHHMMISDTVSLYRVIFFNWASPENVSRLAPQKMPWLPPPHSEKVLSMASERGEIRNTLTFSIPRRVTYRPTLSKFRGRPVKKITLYKGINALYWPSIINYQLLLPHSVLY